MTGLDFTPLFVIGAPRSGTTWIQNMLGAHPEVCAPQELGLFHGYLSGWKAKWDEELQDSTRSDARRRGLPAALTGDEFRDLLRRTAVDIYRVASRSKPSMRVLLDKEPSNTFHSDLVADLFPEARFIHLLRDGRDVAASLVAAGREEWARDWAPTRVADAARTWQDHVVAARRARSVERPYLEVRYEDLLADPVGSLLHLFDFAGVGRDADAAARIAEEFSFARVREGGSRSSGLTVGGELSAAAEGSGGEPKGFYRRGVAGSWRDEWSEFDRAEFDRVAGALLVEAGYEPSRDWCRPSPRARLARAGSALRDGMKERVKVRIRAFNSRHPSLRE